ncbi:MAG: ribosome maturation factor RimP [Clostridia bacterium]|nr:ribosome maturation factor RimP [Clostridia bacterium]MDD4047473.1 ribosome maturation factor RimP [Clostridia bacterium]
MQKEKVQDIIFDLVQSSIEENDVELVDVEFIKEGVSWYLRVYIDKDDGVDLEVCQKISKIVSDILDKKDPIVQPYFLEVSSPGVGRVLKREKDFKKFFGHSVVVKTYTLYEGKKEHRGKLGVVDSSGMELIEDGDKKLNIPQDIIALVKLDWEE